MVVGIALAIGGAWSAQVATPTAAAVAAKPKPLVGHRIAGSHPLSAFTASPKHLRDREGRWSVAEFNL
jgi:hypothetical protein